MFRLLPALFLLLTACADWPDAGGLPMSRSAEDWPALLPLDGLIGTGELPAADDRDAEALLNRAAALRARAAILRGDSTDMEELRARLRR